MIRIGIVGLGYLGRIHLQVLQGLSAAFQLVGVHDRHPEKAKEIQQIYPTIAVFDDYDNLLDATDAIGIIASTPSHYELANLALRKGKAVFIEKPMCATMQEATNLLGVQIETNGFVQVGHVERFNPAWLQASKLLQQQAIHTFQASRCAPFQSRGTDVSVVFDLMIHDLDILLSLHNSAIKSMVVEARSEQSVFADSVEVQLTFEDGCVATLAASRIAADKQRSLAIQTAAFSLDIDLLQQQIQVQRSAHAAFEQIAVLPGNALQSQWQDFANCLQSGFSPKVGAVQGLSALELAERIELLAQVQLQQKSNHSIQ